MGGSWKTRHDNGSAIELARLIRQHDRHSITDRIGERGLLTDQLLRLPVISQRATAHWANQHFEELGIDPVMMGF